MCELEGGKAKLDRGCHGLGVTGDGCSAAGWCSAVAMAMAGGVPGRREESGGADWGGMERRGGVPVEAAGESRTEVPAQREGGAGVEAEAEAAAAHQDGSGGGGQASRRRRRGGERLKIGRGGAAEDDRENEEEENKAHQYIPQALWYRVKKQPGA